MSSLPNQELTPSELDELLSAVLPDIPGYRVVRLLGRGGMSYVYLGIQESLDRQVAIKVISPLALNDEVSLLRFEREARTIAKLQHPSIVAIHAVGRMDGGLLYYVMPYLSHGHVGRRDLRNEQSRIIGVLRALLGALDYAHAQGIVHRDVKAENVLFDQNDRPMLTDFGIATSKRDKSRMTGAGNAIGSWGYMAPEQARGERVDGRADLYSVGVLTYEMLTSSLPFRSDDTVALALMHAMDPVPPLPPDKAHWRAFVERAMAKRPEGRFANAREMLLALDAIALERAAAADARTLPVRARAQAWLTQAATRLKAGASALPALRTSRSEPAPGSGRRWPRPAALAAGSLVLLALVLVLGVWFSGRDGSAPALPPAAAPLLSAEDGGTSGAGSEVALADADDAAIQGRGAVPADAAAADVAADDLEEALLTMPPGELALLTATEQIRRKRLTQPKGDSAIDSLLFARQLLGPDPRVAATAEQWLAAVAPYVQVALARRDDAGAVAFIGHIDRLEQGLAMGDIKGAGALRESLTTVVRADLRDAVARKDPAARNAARQRAARLGLPAARLEPEYSQPIVTGKLGDALRGSVATVIVRMPEGSTPGLAAMPAAVTQGEYGAYAKATGRPASQCRIRTAVITVKARSWSSPGFAQSADHPVVCVSEADAQAYAAWLGQRDGVRYRLPTQAEWRLASGAPAGAACGAAGLRCQSSGTVSATAGAKNGNGVHSTLGNVREWTSDCAGCREHPTLGLGWRDAEPSRKGAQVNPEFGYDDLGFRLVREVPREAVEQR